MSQKNKQQLLQSKEKLEQDKVKFETVKANQPEKWTAQMQVKLDEVIGEIADIDEEIKALYTEEEKAESTYVPEKGTEKMVHVMISRGRRFNPQTGKEESKPYKQYFTHGEFLLFEKNAALLGYVIMKVLHDPYGIASETVVTK